MYFRDTGCFWALLARPLYFTTNMDVCVWTTQQSSQFRNYCKKWFSVALCLPWMQQNKQGLLKCWDIRCGSAPFHCNIHRLNKKGAWWSLKCVVMFLLWFVSLLSGLKGNEWWIFMCHCACLFLSHQCFFYFCFIVYLCGCLLCLGAQIIKWLSLHVYVHVCPLCKCTNVLFFSFL